MEWTSTIRLHGAPHEWTFVQCSKCLGPAVTKARGTTIQVGRGKLGDCCGCRGWPWGTELGRIENAERVSIVRPRRKR